eukprot:UC1_evm1s597
MITAQNVLFLNAAFFGIYGIQMMAMPSMLVAQNFDVPASVYPNPLLDFFMRCTGFVFIALTYVLATKVEDKQAANKLSMVINAIFFFLAPVTAEMTFDMKP